MTNYWVKRFWLKKISLPVQKKIIYIFMIFVATKNGWTKSPPPFVAVVGTGIREPRSGIRDPGSWMDKNQHPGSGIRDKHPGSTTLFIGNSCCTFRGAFSWGLSRGLRQAELLAKLR
jgi:hypothetical protein